MQCRFRPDRSPAEASEAGRRDSSAPLTRVQCTASSAPLWDGIAAIPLAYRDHLPQFRSAVSFLEPTSVWSVSRGITCSVRPATCTLQVTVDTSAVRCVPTWVAHCWSWSRPLPLINPPVSDCGSIIGDAAGLPGCHRDVVLRYSRRYLRQRRHYRRSATALTPSRLPWWHRLVRASCILRHARGSSSRPLPETSRRIVMQCEAPTPAVASSCR